MIVTVRRITVSKTPGPMISNITDITYPGVVGGLGIPWFPGFLPSEEEVGSPSPKDLSDPPSDDYGS